MVASTPTRQDRGLLIVSDGSGLVPDRFAAAPASIALLLEEDAAGIEARAGLPVNVAAVRAGNPAELAAQIQQLSAGAALVFLTHTEPERARVVQQEMAQRGGPPLITDNDSTAITLSAALLNSLARAGHRPTASQVVIAGAARLPELCPLLITIGIADISSWNQSDAHAFPLRHLARHVTAVIDLVHGTPATVQPMTTGETIVINPDDPDHRLLPVAGLARAVVDDAATLDVEVFWSAAWALVATTPVDRRLPLIDDQDVTDAVASAARAVIARRRSTATNGPSSTS